MKKVLTLDEYLQSLALLHLAMEHHNKMQEFTISLEKLMDCEDDKDPDVWEMISEDGTASRELGNFLKRNDIKVDGPTSKYV
jgi:hypothetical protein